MLPRSLEVLGASERRSRSYLVKKVWQKKRRFCIRCRGAKIYRLAEKRYRCARCGYTFQDFSGRWIGRLNLKARQWLWILKLFELEVSTRRIASEIGISYPTALKAVQLIRCAIAQSTSESKTRGEEALEEYYLGCQSRGLRLPESVGRAPVFGVVERHGQVQVILLRHIGAETLLSDALKTGTTGSIVYTDRFRDYDAILFWRHGHVHVEYAPHLTQRKVHNSVEGFCNFARERLSNVHGVSKQSFPLYLKELEFRYNHRQHSIFDLLASYITELVPSPL